MTVIITTKTWKTARCEDADLAIRGSEVDLDEVLDDNCMRTLYVHDADTLDLIRSVSYDAAEAWEWDDYQAHIRDLLVGGSGHERMDGEGYAWACAEQGFDGSHSEWLHLTDDERQSYENGAQGIGTV